SYSQMLRLKIAKIEPSHLQPLSVDRPVKLWLAYRRVEIRSRQTARDSLLQLPQIVHHQEAYRVIDQIAPCHPYPAYHKWTILLALYFSTTHLRDRRPRKQLHQDWYAYLHTMQPPPRQENAHRQP